MSIRTRLIWSFAAMLVVPLVVLLLTTLLMAIASHGDRQYYKKLIFSTAEKFDNDEQFHLLKELKRAEEQNPGILDDPAYLQEVEAELNSDDSGIILRHGSRLTYLSDNMNHDDELLGALPVYQGPGIRSVSLNEKNKVAVVYQFDYSASPGVSSSFFIVTNVDPFLYWIRGAFPTLFTVLVVILILTHVLLTTFVSRSIIRPLHALRVSAKRIKEGDLDHPVALKGKDEIGLLGQAFEEMRVQLKHSIQLQLQYEENRKELVSNISHDLKTPITTIRGYVDGIMDGVADTPEKAKKYMVTIADKAEEMDRLIDELFLYSKLDLKSVPFDFEPILLRTFVEDWSDEMRFDLEKANVIWSADNRIPNSASVMMDRDKFKRVLSNIIQNSVRYMDKPEKRIDMRASVEDGQTVLEIEDNGQGMEPEVLPHIFERFYRAERSRSSWSGGSGLGLAIARQIVLGHNGAISATSEYGKSTTIRIVLPLSEGGENVSLCKKS